MTDQPAGDRTRPRRTARRCPICRAPAVARWRPFCSARCADADLGRWLAGDYRIAASEEDADAEDAKDGTAAGS
jgi:uncharacterized protein